MIATLMFVAWWGHDRVVSLPGGYRYFTSEYGTIIETGPDKMRRTREFRRKRVGADVDGYRVYSHVIIGHVSSPRRASEIQSDSDVAGKPGYFLIDLRTDVVHTGLNRESWRRYLRRYSISEDPELFRPCRLDSYLGRNRPGS
jgi:hypothetical protein